VTLQELPATCVNVATTPEQLDVQASSPQLNVTLAQVLSPVQSSTHGPSAHQIVRFEHELIPEHNTRQPQPVGQLMSPAGHPSAPMPVHEISQKPSLQPLPHWVGQAVAVG
jgi:hypothetical protein